MQPAQIPLEFVWVPSSGPLGGAVLVLGGTALA
jgi:hypothetical protein